MSYISLNGEITEEESSPAGLPAGNGLFESMLFLKGDIILKELHFERLFAGIRGLQFVIPETISAQWLEDEIKRTVSKNGLDSLCRIRLTFLTDGITTSATPNLRIECFAIEPGIYELNETGLSVGIATGIYKETDNLSNIKSCSRQVYIAATQKAAQHKWDDALILNNTGNIIESTIANIFWIKDDNIYTPPLPDGSIAGVMRRYIMQQLAAHDMQVHEESLTKQTLLDTDEVFLTNAVRRIKWIASISDSHYSNTQVKHIHSLIF